jgi:hypothetical protein
VVRRNGNFDRASHVDRAVADLHAWMQEPRRRPPGRFIDELVGEVPELAF